MIKSVLNRAHRAISTSEVFAHESLVELESVSMRRYGRSSIVHKNLVALAIGRFRISKIGSDANEMDGTKKIIRRLLYGFYHFI